jgi:hypothetical protein
MYIIRQPETLEELVGGFNLLCEIFQKHFGTFPRELPHHFFLAFDSTDGNRVVGTINLQMCRSPGEVFEIEHFLECNVTDFYMGSRADVGEVGRLTSICPFVTPYLFCAIGHFAFEFDVQFLVSFNRRLITHKMRSGYGFAVDEYHIPVREEHIPAEYRPYFCNSQDPVVALCQPTACWASRIRQLIVEGEGKVEIILPKSFDQMRELVEQFRQHAAAPTPLAM